MIRYLIAAVLIFQATLLNAALPEIKPGEYVREGDSGTLLVKKDGEKSLNFEIDSIGANCHQCSVSGVLHGSIGKTEGDGGGGSDRECRITFAQKGALITVDPSTPEECQAYCGARASFGGKYFLPSAACTNAGRQKSRDRFLSHYRARQYQQAENTLQSMISQCKKWMSWIEIDQVRNDLALAQYHSGKAAQCVQTLSKTLAAGAKDEMGLKEGRGDVYLPPCDFDNYIEVARATWFNQSLCTKAASGKSGLKQ